MDGWNVNPDFSLAVQAPPEDDITETRERYELFFETGSIYQLCSFWSSDITTWTNIGWKKKSHTFDKLYCLSCSNFEFLSLLFFYCRQVLYFRAPSSCFKALFWVKAPFINNLFHFQIQVWSQLTTKKKTMIQN